MGFLAAIGFVLAFNGVAQTPPPFAADIEHFKVLDKSKPPAPNSILFIGSSSFTRWTDVGSYFPGYPIVNRAFGGSTLLDEIRYVDDVVFPYHPKEIVIYCGENDFAADPKLAPGEVVNRFVKLYRLIRAGLPKTPVVYVSMKPSPSRWAMRAKFQQANQGIQEFGSGQRNFVFVDVWKAMLTPDGNPNPKIFGPDNLHMNAAGYRIWQPLIQPSLIK